MPGLFEGYIARHRRGVTLATLVFISLLFLVVSNRTIIVRPKEIGLSVMAFFQKGVTGFFQWFGDTAGSVRQLGEARAELADATARLQQMDQVTRENVDLRRQNALLMSQLGFAQSLPPGRIGAEVIARDTDNLFSTLTINKGSRGGVQKGMTVVAYQQDMEGLVGKVVAVGPGSSQILPLYDPQCMVSARLDRTRDEGLVNGEGKDSTTVLMRYVKNIAKDAIEYGDLVVTSGLGGLYPKGINIGRIRDIRAQAYETSLELEVEPVINFDRLEYVFLFSAAAAASSPAAPAPAAGGASQTGGSSQTGGASTAGAALP